MKNFSGSYPDGSFTLPDYNSFLGPYDVVFSCFFFFFFHFLFSALLLFSFPVLTDRHLK